MLHIPFRALHLGLVWGPHPKWSKPCSGGPCRPAPQHRTCGFSMIVHLGENRTTTASFFSLAKPGSSGWGQAPRRGGTNVFGA